MHIKYFDAENRHSLLIKSIDRLLFCVTSGVDRYLFDIEFDNRLFSKFPSAYCRVFQHIFFNCKDKLIQLYTIKSIFFFKFKTIIIYITCWYTYLILI